MYTVEHGDALFFIYLFSLFPFSPCFSCFIVLSLVFFFSLCAGGDETPTSSNTYMVEPEEYQKNERKKRTVKWRRGEKNLHISLLLSFIKMKIKKVVHFSSFPSSMPLFFHSSRPHSHSARIFHIRFSLILSSTPFSRSSLSSASCVCDKWYSCKAVITHLQFSLWYVDLATIHKLDYELQVGKGDFWWHDYDGMLAGILVEELLKEGRACW